tara:strand:+ start:105 stop:572 length:468 start_codon:yes stop_codon:yes gene_type:complete
MKNILYIIILSFIFSFVVGCGELPEEKPVSAESFTITIEEIIDAVDSGNPNEYAKLLTEDSRFRFGNWPEVKGKKAIHKAQTEFYASVKKTKHEIIRHWKNDSSIVADMLVTYTRIDGSTLTLPVVDIFEIKGNKVDATFIYMDIAPLYEKPKSK